MSPLEELHHLASERPILFRPELVRAIREGRKTETRRLVKPQPDLTPEYGPSWDKVRPEDVQPACPYGKRGDVLWVRTTWAAKADLDDVAPRDMTPGKTPIWTKDAGKEPGRLWPRGRWRPSIHMPRWACQDLLDVLEVRMEPLQDITTEGILAEGVGDSMVDTEAQILTKWIELWDSINAARGAPWDSDPWVWVVRFKRKVNHG